MGDQSFVVHRLAPALFHVIARTIDRGKDDVIHYIAQVTIVTICYLQLQMIERVQNLPSLSLSLPKASSMIKLSIQCSLSFLSILLQLLSVRHISSHRPGKENNIMETV